jgi:hypothetical protein
MFDYQSGDDKRLARKRKEERTLATNNKKQKPRTLIFGAVHTRKRIVNQIKEQFSFVIHEKTGGTTKIYLVVWPSG